MRSRPRATLLCLCLGLGAIACGGSGGGTGPSESADGGAMAEGSSDDAPPAPPFSQAAHPPMPRVVTYGGPVLTHPKVLPIVFAGDPFANDIRVFTSTLGQTAYWNTIASEYGVGPLTGEAAVVVPETPPASIANDQIPAWLSSKMTAGVLPMPDGSTIYAIFYPSGTIITSGGAAQSCVANYGYHDEGTAPNGAAYPFAVLPRCHNAWQSDLANLTNATSHEYLEASTDPLTETAKAYYDVDPDHYAWAVLAGGPAEIGDMCTVVIGADYYGPPGFPYVVQRMWSNAAAAAGHDPCVPAETGPYFNAAPVLDDAITINAGNAGKVATRGVRIPVGQTRTIEVDLYSDAPTNGPWNVQAADLGKLAKKAPLLDLSLDRATGQNGDKLNLTITPLHSNTYGIEVFFLVSSLAGRESIWVGLVGNE